ncbi:zinc-binding dehydrogenase [Nesterenkonia ebinurensis]|uniref:zinc-binding dehydrogenase n=1 Tax=Nesterenkonia ebinurensis TaxID=2608252 RepID=UPI00123CB3CF|nr:zinc-binding dehydrogenase [Nesterenkonia ebinurensis]
MNSSIPEFAQAVVIERFGQSATLQPVPIPDKLEPGALLVQVEACSVCGTDVHLWRGELSLRVDLPVILGHEMVGRVVAAGTGSEKDSFNQELNVGDRIVWSHAECKQCRFCVSGLPTLCANKRSYMYENCREYPYLLGGFGEYAYVLPDSGRVRVPDNVSNELASLSSCAFRSVVNAFNQVGQISPSDVVMIQGIGPLGLLGVAMAKLAGSRKIIALGEPAERRELAKRFGADDVFSIAEASGEERRAAVLGATEGNGADLVFEFSGNPRAFTEGLELVAPGGRYMVVGQLGTGEVQFAPSLITKKNLQVMGSFSGSIRHYWQALEIVSRHQGDMPFAELITGTYGLDEVDDALNAMRAETEIKPLIVPGK